MTKGTFVITDKVPCPICGDSDPRHEITAATLRQKWFHDPKSYRSQLIDGRYQIMELGHGVELFVIYDYNTGLSSKKSEQVIHFKTPDQALAHLQAQTAKPKKAPAPMPTGPSGPDKTAAAMFRRLILERKLDDDKIFDLVKEAFKLDESKRSYVKAYRRDLIKAGQYQEG